MVHECSVDGCAKPLYCRGLCTAHYSRLHRFGDVGTTPLGVRRTKDKSPTICSIADCEREAKAGGLCHLHYQRLRRHGDAHWEPSAPVVVVCSVTGCDKPKFSIGLCAGHHSRFQRTGDVGPAEIRSREPKPCIHEGCTARGVARGFCRTHYAHRQQSGEFGPSVACGADGCDANHWAKGFCKRHYSRLLTGTEINKPFRVMGAGHVTKNGYRVMSRDGHPNAASDGHIFEHVLMMAESLGRPLVDEETVHHKNGQRADNRLTKGHELGGCPPTCCNLELWSSAQPSGQRVADKIAWMKDFIARYE